jgi:hypothetical protein
MIHQSEAGEKHIADVKTEYRVVLEFQHSHLRRDEREAREKFYQKMVWVVDGVRRKRDTAQFFALVDQATILNREPLIVSVQYQWESALFRDWEASNVPVYFDFRDAPVLWRLNPLYPERDASVGLEPRDGSVASAQRGVLVRQA